MCSSDLYTSHGVTLPPILDVEREIGLPQIENTDDNTSKQLYDSRKRLLRLRHHSDLFEHILCPVCLNICTSKTIVTCCVVAEHHMCFDCIVSTLLHSPSRTDRHRCPTCQCSMYTKRPSSTMLSIVDAIADHTDTRISSKYMDVYEKFTEAHLVNQYVPYSYNHIRVFVNILSECMDIDVLLDRLDAVQAAKTLQIDIDAIVYRCGD